MDGTLTDWLLDSDPASRWQVERDLLGAPEAVWTATRARVATEGSGARLLALQDPDGQWAGGAFFPGDFDFHGPEAAEGAGQPWTATTWTPANGVWLGADVEGIAAWFVEHRLADGGWNCDWVEGATRSSFHSTLHALKGLLAHQEATGGSDETCAARRAGEEYLLERRLMRRRSTGEVVAPWVTEFAYPPRWRYSVLNAAEHFRAAPLLEGTPPDPRMADAIEAIRAARQPDGTWLQARRHPGRVWFEIDVPVGEPSKWLTLSALRVLAWWDAAGQAPRAA